MISRRLLRIKILQILYAYYKSEQKDINKAEKELHFSINKAYELFYYLILLIIEVKDYANNRIEIGFNKKIPDHQDLYPNKRFVENIVIKRLNENKPLYRYVETHHISWVNYPELIKELFALLIESDVYKEYMNKEVHNFDDDKKLVDYFFTDIVQTNESLYQIIEEKSIYWNDDLDFVLSMVVKYIRKIKETDSEEKQLPELYKNAEDKEYALNLFRKSLVSRDYCLKLIEEKASNWDLERIAFVDVLIMQIAITEMIEFPSIPTRVTLNEFLEIAKFYSTEKSNSFINGVLDKILQQLKAEDKIKKTGRGLIGEL